MFERLRTDIWELARRARPHRTGNLRKMRQDRAATHITRTATAAARPGLERIRGLAPDRAAGTSRCGRRWPRRSGACARSRPRRSERTVANVLQPAPTRAWSSTSLPARGTWPPSSRPEKRTAPPARTARGVARSRARAGVRTAAVPLAGSSRASPANASAQPARRAARAAGPRRGPAASVRSVHAPAAAITTVRFAHTRAPRVAPAQALRERDLASAERLAAGRQPRAQRGGPCGAGPARCDCAAGSVSAAGAPSTRRVPTVSLPATSVTSARSS